MPKRASDFIAQAETLYSQTLTPEKTREIRKLLERGLAETSGLLANIIVCDYLNQWNKAGAEELAAAGKAVKSALQLVPDVAIAYHAKGFIHRAKRQHKAALAAFDQSLRYNPDFARARAQKANVLFYLGRFPQALTEIETVIQNSAGSPSLGMFQWIKGRTLFLMGRYEHAVAALRESIASWPELWYNRLYLVSAYAHLGNGNEARRALDEFHKRFPQYTIGRVVENEKANPSSHPNVVKGRETFHEGLRLAGMPP
jgi:tetratricopeptide (TPR) repeat protein